MGPERHGRVRGYGLGPTPTSIFGSTSTQYRTNLEAMRVELNTMHARMEEMQKKHEEDRRAYLERMEKQQECMRATMAEMMMQIPSQQQNPSEGKAFRKYALYKCGVDGSTFNIGLWDLPGEGSQGWDCSREAYI